MFYKIVILFTFFNMSYAQESKPESLSKFESKELKEQLIYDFKKYETLEKIKLTGVITELSKKTHKFIKMRRGECLGEFSVLEVDDENKVRAVKKKLTKREQKLCMLELIKFQKKYTNIIYKMRRKELTLQHKEQLNSIDQYWKKNQEELDKLATKYK